MKFIPSNRFPVKLHETKRRSPTEQVSFRSDSVKTSLARNMIPEPIRHTLESYQVPPDDVRAIDGIGETGILAFSVAGDSALECAQRLQQLATADESKYWPVIIGADDTDLFVAARIRGDVDREYPNLPAEQRYTQSVAESIEKARQIDFPSWVKTRRDPATRIAECRERIRVLTEANAPKILIELQERWIQRFETATPPPFDPADFEPPEQPLAPRTRLEALRDINAETAADDHTAEINVDAARMLLVPIDEGSWEVPIRLRFGSLNESPPPEMNAAFCVWAVDQGATLIAISHYIGCMEFSVPDPTDDWHVAVTQAHAGSCFAEDFNGSLNRSLPETASRIQKSTFWTCWWD